MIYGAPSRERLSESPLTLADEASCPRGHAATEEPPFDPRYDWDDDVDGEHDPGT